MSIVSTIKPLRQAVVTTLFKVARRHLYLELGLPVVQADISWEDNLVSFRKVNITLRNNGAIQASMSGKGATLTQAIAQAMARAVQDDRFGSPIMATEAHDVVIELLIQTGRSRLDNTSLKSVQEQFKLGVDGIEIRLGEHYAYFKPCVAITSGISTHEKLLTKLCRKAKLPTDAWQSPSAKLRRTQWLHFVEAQTPEGYIELYRARRKNIPAITSEAIHNQMILTAQRLKQAQDEAGRFDYCYDAGKDRVDNTQFNLVRMAGCAYSMARVAAYGQGQEWATPLSKSAQQAIQYLLSLIRPVAGVDEGRFIANGTSRIKRRKGKLGSTALTLLAMQFGAFPKRFAMRRQQLTETILSQQNEDGSFQCWIYGKNASSDWCLEKDSSQDYFPGEALLALFHEWRYSQDSRILSAIRRAFPFYQHRFKTQPSTAFVLWQSDVWRSLVEYFHVPNPNISDSLSATELFQYATFVFEQIDWLLQFQYTPELTDFEEYVGGFPYPSTPRYSTAVYLEAIIRACGLAHRAKDIERFNRYRQAALSGLNFLARLQLGPDSSFLFKNPSLSIGGITKNLNSLLIRNDFDQHAITAWIAALETPIIFSA